MQKVIACVLAFTLAAIAALEQSASAEDDGSADIDVQLIVQCYKGNPSNVARLLRSGADPNSVFGIGSQEAGQLLGIDEHPRDSFYWTPLHALADPIDPVNFAGPTPKTDMSSGAKSPRYDPSTSRATTALLLFASGAKLDATMPSGYTPLHLAAESRQLQLSQMLLQLGASVQPRTLQGFEQPAGRSALHFASWSAELRTSMIAMGAKDDLSDDSGVTPLQLRKKFVRVERKIQARESKATAQ